MAKIFTHIQKGDAHPVFCEDFFMVEESHDKFLVASVMDGCSGGKETHFSSSLMAKSLRKAIKESTYLKEGNGMNAKQFIHYLLKNTFKDLQEVRNQFLLSTEELVSTILLLVYNRETHKAFIIAIGDGIIAINQKIYRIEQHNMPDYMAYHLGNDFEKWFEKQKQFFSIHKPENLAISTDGVDSFLTPNLSETNTDVAKLLLIEKPKSFKKQIHRLKELKKLSPQDDLAIVRIVFD